MSVGGTQGIFSGSEFKVTCCTRDILPEVVRDGNEVVEVHLSAMGGKNPGAQMLLRALNYGIEAIKQEMLEGLRSFSSSEERNLAKRNILPFLGATCEEDSEHNEAIVVVHGEKSLLANAAGDYGEALLEKVKEFLSESHHKEQATSDRAEKASPALERGIDETPGPGESPDLPPDGRASVASPSQRNSSRRLGFSPIASISEKKEETVDGAREITRIVSFADLSELLGEDRRIKRLEAASSGKDWYAPISPRNQREPEALALIGSQRKIK